MFEQFIKSTFDLRANLVGVIEQLGIAFVVVTVENFRDKIRAGEYIYIEIDIIKHLVFKFRRHADVAIEISELTRGFVKPENVIPAIEPIIFVRDGPLFYMSKIGVVNVCVKLPNEDEQGIPPFKQLALPAPADSAIELPRVYRDHSGGVRTISTEQGA